MIKKRITPTDSGTSQHQRVEIHNPEIVFGIVGPIGVDITAVIEALSASLSALEYHSVLIHVTDHMRNKRIRTKIDESSYFARYMSLIRYANEYRAAAKNPAALAGLALLQIRRERARISQSEKLPALGTAYIIRQFKRGEEIDLMRKTYGRKFVQVSVYGNDADRRSVLIDKIRRYDLSPKSDAECESQAIRLIEVDNNEVDNTNGQRVSDAFHLGDVFVDSKNASITIDRFIRAFFGDNTVSPSKDEYGLYTAAAASLRSIDLSRQVGAAIFTKKSEVVSLGCNEVPRPKGGTYWFDDEEPTFRDADIGSDANQERRNEIFFDLIDRLSKEGFLMEPLDTPSDVQHFVSKVTGRKRIKDSQLMDIIEFGRMIHAEMSAISDAARLGRATEGTTLYCTAFPCHLCAKHIVASGIYRVVFLEPYPKSYAKKLHDDSITFDPDEKRKVLFQPFIGISPRRYRDIFEKRSRKEGAGTLRKWYEQRPVPRIEDRSGVYIDNEGPLAVYALGSLYRRGGAFAR